MSEQEAATRAPTGTRDILWPESYRWERLVASFAMLAQRAGFGLVHTPMFEDVRVFRRGIGEATDVVGKEMYEFTDRGGRDVALRPEGTASLVRAFVQHRPVTPWKAWYVTPAFRYERPQAGRYRQHHQVGVEALGSADPDLDVEVLVLAHDFLAGLGLADVELLVNSMGDAVCRPAYVEALRSYLEARRDQLCPEHRQRLEVNPLRVLDCKKPECQAVTAEAPVLLDFLCDDCRSHLDRVLEGLTSNDVSHRISPHLVRGLDYYTRTTFEFVPRSPETAQSTLCGGGRYDGLVESLGGPPTPGIGFGSGIERLLLACDAEGVFDVVPPAPDAYVVDTAGGQAARDLVVELRRAGWSAERSLDGRTMKAQLRSADRSGAAVALIIGPRERDAGTVTLRRLRGDSDPGTGPGGRTEGGRVERSDDAQREIERGAVVEALAELLAPRASGHGGRS